MKTNIGHTEGSSGLAGIIKAVLSMEHGAIAPNCNFEFPNPHIDFEGWNIKVPTALTPWPTQDQRRVSINSFGFGGTNAHVSPSVSQRHYQRMLILNYEKVILDDAYNYLKSRHLTAPHRTKTLPLALEDVNKSYINGHTNTNCTNGANGDNGHAGTNGHTNGINGHVNGREGNGMMVAEKGSAVEQRYRVFLWSTHEEAVGSKYAASYAQHLSERVEADEVAFMDNLAHTLVNHRSRLSWKSHIVSNSLADLVEQISTTKQKAVRSLTTDPRLAFVFTGQGAQWFAMGRELKLYKVFRERLEYADRELKALGADWSLLEELELDQDDTRVNQPFVSQPACTALQIALVDLYKSWGITPRKVIGHSSGEIAAAYAAGILSFHAALRVAYMRGLYSSKVNSRSTGPAGAMMAVGLSQAEADAAIASLDPSLGKAVVACINSPSNVTVSGDRPVLEALMDGLGSRNIFCRFLQVKTAYHSHHMETVAADYQNSLKNLPVYPIDPSVEMVSTVTGHFVAKKQILDGKYWTANMVSSVLFSQGLEQLCLGQDDPETKPKGVSNQAAVDILIEIGPHAALSGPVKQILAIPTLVKSGIVYKSALMRKVDACKSALETATFLFSKGCPVDLNILNNPETPAAKPHILVDLPPYLWNHSKRYWCESRLSIEHRFRRHGRSDFVGYPVSDWNPSEPRWRNMIKLKEQPWLMGHKVQGSYVFPATGYVAMAVEATRFLHAMPEFTAAGQKITGFHIKDLNITRAMIIPATENGIETMFSLRQYKESSTSFSNVWYEFRAYSYSSDHNEWAEHAHGVISTIYDEVQVLDQEQYQVQKTSYMKAGLPRTQAGETLYEEFSAAALVYVEPFQNIQEVVSGPEGAIGTVEIPDTKVLMPYEWESDYIAHPAVLDNFVQLLFPALSFGSVGPQTPYVPVSFSEIKIDAGISRTSGHQFSCLSRAAISGYREVTADIFVADSSDSVPRVRMSGVKCRALAGGAVDDEEAQRDTKRLCFQAAWEADVDLLPREVADDILCKTVVAPPDPARVGEMETLCWYYYSLLLEELSEDETVSMPSHLLKMYRYIQHQRDLVEAGQLPHQTAVWKNITSPESRKTMETLMEKISASGSDGKLLCRVGPKLSDILTGKVDPLALMLQDGLLYTYYDSVMTDGVLNKYMSMLSHKNPNMKILEIGAGTGGATLPCLQGLGGANGQNARFQSYTFTDVSTGFFEEAQVKFKAWEGLVDYRRLDIERDPVESGFEEGGYDVVVACLVLHATANIDRTLQNTRKLLKTGGRLVLCEISQALNQVFMMFGCLPGWWMAEEANRQWGPCLNEEQWAEALQRNGFAAPSASVPNNLELKDEQGRVISCVAIEPSEAAAPAQPSFPDVALIVDNKAPATKSLTAELTTQLKTMKSNVKVYNVSELQGASLDNTVCISLLDLDKPFVRDMSSSGFAALQQLCRESKGLFWVTEGACSAASNPDAALIHGLARSIRCENETFPFVIADLAVGAISPDKAARELLVLVKDAAKRGGPSEYEYWFSEGCWHNKRCLENEEANRQIYQRINQHISGIQQPQPVTLGETDRVLKLTIRSPGLLDTLVFQDEPLPALGADEVEIDVRACGVNFRDIMICSGQLSDSSLGLECAGVVSKVGAQVSHLRVGQRVTAWTYGNYRRFLNNPACMVQPIPDDMGFAEAAAIPIAYCTAVYGLSIIGRLRKGESVLIHSAAGGVGQAAILLAQHCGAEIFVTVGNQAKRDLMRNEFGIPEDHIFSSRNLSFASGIQRMTKGRGVDVVLNSLAGDALSATWECVATFGRFIEMGKKDISENRRLEMAPFKRNITFSSIDLITVFKQDLGLAAELLETSMKLIHAGSLRAMPRVKTFTFSQFEEAFRFMQSGKHIGKIVVMPADDDVVQAIPDPAGMRLPENATYLLSGGLGGLGRSIARWMVGRGARNLVFLSRSGANNDAARELIQELRDDNVKVEVLKTDITDLSVLRSDLQPVLRGMPPVRGVIQAAMVLEDQIFDNMTCDAFKAAIRPKVHGSWNLHEASLGMPLDFFLILASAVGVLGNPGQGNYAAGNAYEDALAHYRTARGLPAIAIDLGMILGVGKVAEDDTGKKKRNLERQGFVGIHEDELLCLMEMAMTATAPPTQDNCQIITGIQTHDGASGDGDGAAADAKDDFRPFWKSDPVFSHVKTMGSRGATAGAGRATTQSFQALMGVALTLQDAAAVALEAVSAKLSRSLMIDRADMDAGASTSSYGVDSLIAVEVRNWLIKEVRVDVPVFEILQANSLQTLAMLIAEKWMTAAGQVSS